MGILFLETYLMIKVLHCLHNCFNRTQTKLLLNFFKKTPISTQKSKINTYLRRPKIVLKGNIIELGVLPQARRYHQKN